MPYHPPCLIFGFSIALSVFIMASKLEQQSRYYNSPGRPQAAPRPVVGDQKTSYDNMNPMQRFQSSETVNMSTDQFEKLFLSQQNSLTQLHAASQADWRKSLGNPTPM